LNIEFGPNKCDSKMTPDQSWGTEFKDLRSHLEQALDASRRMAEWSRIQLGSPDMPPGIAILEEQISIVESLASRLFERLFQRPSSLLLSGQHLSREEFYLLVALGVLKGGSYTGDAYADFQMLHYEDEKRRSYITLEEQPRAGRIKLHFGMWPEEISWNRLRPDQRAFFERHLPEVAARFRKP
jgi:hypothetical protein